MTVISTRGEHNYDIFTSSKKDMIDQVMSNPGSDRIATQLEGYHEHMFKEVFNNMERTTEQVPDIVRERTVDHSAGI